MPRLGFHTVTPEGQPGDVLGTVDLLGEQIVSTPGVAADTIAMLARRTGRSEAEVFRLLVEQGWSNGQIMTVVVD